MNRRLLLPVLIVAALLPRLALAQGASAQPVPDRELDRIPRLELPEVDLDQARLDDEERVLRGNGAQYAVALEVNVIPWDEGQWEMARLNHARWRLRLSSPGALSLNLAFSRYKMPPEGELTIYSPDGRHRIGPFTERDNEEHGELWTPPLLTDELILEVTLPFELLGELELRLAKVHHGYAGFGEAEPKSGPCEVDLACTPAEIWRDAARSVALISVEGVRFCTGFLVNNTALDGKPLFITAHHCGVNRRNAASVVVLWNHESPVCRDGDEAAGEPGDLSQFQTGAVFRAAYRPSDVVLIELDDPPDPAFNVFYAGWDRSETDPRRTVVIHHPNTDVKRISFDYDRATATPHLSSESLAKGNHLRIADWDLGTTEGGSSGAPLFNQDMRVVGQLHGGYAACDDRQADWFGRFSASWTGNGRPGLRLSDWLDPLSSEALTLDGIEGAAVSSEPHP
ncbi:MAG: trypsin-like peptidase domain-containing protein [bacterium]|nr:trypsin-like peptidase domain-containing protein [bacterium]